MPQRLFASASTWVLLQRLWLAAAGVVTTWIIARHLSLEQQGWYYAFQSAAAAFALSDLGLSALLLNITVRSAAGAELGRGKLLLGAGRERLAAFLKQVQMRYFASALVCLLLGPLGLLVFLGRDAWPGWPLAWGVVVLLSAAGQAVLPWTTWIEGLGRVREAYALRMLQGVLSYLLIWACLLAGEALYAVAMAPLAALVVYGSAYLGRYRGLGAQIVAAEARGFAWRDQVGALHARTAVSWIASLALGFVCVPVVFRVAGARAAGQLGLTLSVANMLASLAQSWLSSHMTLLAQCAARRDWVGMDQAFAKVWRRGIGAYLAGSAGLLLLDLLLQSSAYGDRLLPPPLLALLLLATLASHVATLLETQIRAYGRDPFARSSASSAILTVLLLVPLAQHSGNQGVVVLMLAVNLLLRLPWVATLHRALNRNWRAAVRP